LNPRAVESPPGRWAVVARRGATEATEQIPVDRCLASTRASGGHLVYPRCFGSLDALPVGLLDSAATNGGAQQRADIGGEPYFVVAVQLTDAMYVEVFSLQDLNRTLTIGGWLLLVQTIIAGGLGALIGRYTVGQILRPLRRLGAGARRIASGDLGTRIDETGDRDLDPIAESFNEMAGAVQSRIQRERRFSANVSHELRSPLTTVVGTADLLDRRREELPEREAKLITVLVEQVHRMSQMLLDLLEISRIGGETVS
jgi:Signal transduction histidine kinase